VETNRVSRGSQCASHSLKLGVNDVAAPRHKHSLRETLQMTGRVARCSYI
jgi:hypothetical protein